MNKKRAPSFQNKKYNRYQFINTEYASSVMSQAALSLLAHHWLLLLYHMLFIFIQIAKISPSSKLLYPKLPKAEMKKTSAGLHNLRIPAAMKHSVCRC